MTTTNGSRIVEHVDGVVASSNERGCKLVGETEYRNFSKFGEPIAPPSRGQRVSLGLDASGFVRELQVLDGGVASSSTPAPTRDREIRRQVAMKTAAQLLGAFAQCREEVKLDHLFPLADRVLAWLEQPEKGEDEPI